MKLPKILKNSGLYSVASFLQKGISFFLLPIYTTYLTSEDYGKLSIIQSIVSFLSIFLLLSLHASAGRLHFISNNKYRRARIWGTTLMLVIYNSIFLGAIFIIGHKFLIDPFAKGIQFFPLIFISLIGTILSPVYLFFQSWLQVTQQGTRYAINMFINFIVATTLSIVSLTVFKAGIYGLVCSALITSILFFIYSFISFFPVVKIKINKKISIQSFKYALPILPHSVSSWLMVMVDRLMINNFIGSSQTGIYSVAYSFGGILNIVTTSVNQAFSPWFFQKVSEDRTNLSSIYSFAEIITIGYCFIAMSITLFSPEVVRLMTTKSFHTAWQPIVFISFGYVFSGLYYFLAMPLWLKNTKFVFIITLVSAGVAVILNFILIPLYGIIGSGISLLVSLCVSSIIGLFLSNRMEQDINFPWKKLYGIVTMFFSISFFVFIIEASIASIMLKICIKFSFFLVILSIFFYLYRNILINFIQNRPFR